MAPTLGATRGVKGHRPTVGTRDCKDLLYVFAVVNLLSAAVHSNTLESPKAAKKRTGQSKTRRLQEAFADHLRHVGRVYPRDKHPEVVLRIDTAPWRRGKPVDQALAEYPHLKFKRLPSYSPPLNPIERFWKKLRRRTTGCSTPWPTSSSRSGPASATSRPCAARSKRCWKSDYHARRNETEHRVCVSEEER